MLLMMIVARVDDSVEADEADLMMMTRRDVGDAHLPWSKMMMMRVPAEAVVRRIWRRRREKRRRRPLGTDKEEEAAKKGRRSRCRVVAAVGGLNVGKTTKTTKRWEARRQFCDAMRRRSLSSSSSSGTKKAHAHYCCWGHPGSQRGSGPWRGRRML